MTTSAQRLKAVLTYLNITPSALSRALGVDPSLVSRWLSGSRYLRAASPQMENLADYLLSRGKRVHDIEWLKTQFEAAKLPGDLTSVYAIKQNLILWLASDGDDIRRNLGGAPQARKTPPPKPAADPHLGVLDTVLSLRRLLSQASKGAAVDLFLSSDRIQSVVNADVAALLSGAVERGEISLRMAVCVSGDTRAMSNLVDAYMKALITGGVRLCVVHGLTEPVARQMYVILPTDAALLVTETPGGGAPPVSVLVRDGAFLTEIRASFEASFRYAQSVLTVYGDEYTRDVIEILALEYCTPGALDVVKDSVNPMFMTPAAYDRFLRTRGHGESEFAWRSAEFVRFKTGMDGNLKSGSVFREVLSLSRLREIAQRGACRMAGLYFAERGYVDLDRQGCLDILNGYVAYLENEPNFHLRLLDDLDELHGNNCWHIKQNSHISINNWQGASPVMVHSDQLMLLREFQARYDALWDRGANAIGSRAGVIDILRDVAGRLEKV